MSKSLKLFPLPFLLLINHHIAAQATLENHRYNYELLKQARKDITFKQENRQEAFRITHKILKKTNNEKDIIYGYTNIGAYHYYKYATDSALFYTKKAISLIGNKQDSTSLKSLSYCYVILSNASRDKNLIDESKKWALKGIETSKKINDTIALHKHTSNLAITYRISGDIPKALELFEMIIDKKWNSDLTKNNYISIALCYADLKKYKKALVYYQKALKYYESIDNQRSKAITLMNIGVVYSNTSKIDLALSHFNKSLLIANTYDYPLIALNNKINISETFQNKKQYKKAKKGFLKVLYTAKKSGYLKQQLYVYKALKDIAIDEQNYKKALVYSEKKSNIQDSIKKMQQDKEVAKLEIQYETLKKEQEILLLKKNQELKALEIKRQQFLKKILTYSFIIILIPLIGLLFLYFKKLKSQNLLNKKQKEISEQKIDALIRDQELKLIKTSLNTQYKERKRIAQELHDSIGGNLAAIKLQFSSVAGNIENLGLIHQQLDDTYKQVRMLSHNLIPEKFRLNNFTQLLKEYMNNIGNSSDLVIKISTFPENKINELDHFFHNKIFSVFQELITNTIKHANASEVQIQIDIIKDIIYIIFEDNGIGFDTSIVPLGIGLSNIENRIHKLSGVLRIDSHPKRGTIINIEMQKPL